MSRLSKPLLSALLGACALLSACTKKTMNHESAETVSGPFFRTMVYACDGGSSWVARFDGDSVWLRGAEGRHVLPQTASASGARYADSALAFWIHGGQASLEKASEPPRLCRYDSMATAWEKAWARGVNIRATGAEIAEKGKIGWYLEITAGKQAVFVSENGKTWVNFRDTIAVSEPSSRRVYGSWRKLAVEWDRRPCREGGSGEPLELVVKVDYAGKRYQGCGRLVESRLAF
jgi:membrane-bound inhibitor of C-type lysozyme